MTTNSLPTTLGELRDSGYQTVSVREEIHRNLIAKIRAEEPVFPGIIGFDQTVIPQLENAILAGQDIILLGERGQAKTRLIREMVNLLDEHIPTIEGSELNDDPYHPISPDGQRIVAEMGDAAPIDDMYGIHSRIQGMHGAANFRQHACCNNTIFNVGLHLFR